MTGPRKLEPRLRYTVIVEYLVDVACTEGDTTGDPKDIAEDYYSQGELGSPDNHEIKEAEFFWE